MKIMRLVRVLKRGLTPPGSRGPVDSSYRQPHITGNSTNVPSPMSDHDRGGPT